MTRYEVRWCSWLYRELARELGMPAKRNGRPPKLRSSDKASLFAEISKTAHKRRGAVYGRFSKELKVGISTLQNAMGAMWKAAGVTRTRLRVEPENYALGET